MTGRWGDFSCEVAAEGLLMEVQTQQTGVQWDWRFEDKTGMACVDNRKHKALQKHEGITRRVKGPTG